MTTLSESSARSFDPRAPRAFPPGPRSRIPGRIVYSLRTDTLNFLTRTAREYGDFVPFRVGPWLYVLLNDPDAIRDVLVTDADRYVKGPALRRAKDTLGEGLLTSEGEFHRRQRRLSQPAFHPQRVAGYAGVMADIAGRACAAWRDGERIDAHRQMMRVTLRIVAKTLFDADVESDVRTIGHAMDVAVNMFTRAMNPWGPLLNVLPLPGNFRFRRARALLFATVDRFIQDRRVNGTEGRTDLLSTLVRAREDGDKDQGGTGADEATARDRMKDERNAASPVHPSAFSLQPCSNGGMSDQQLRDESLTLFTAGHETTANALTFAWHLLSRNPAAEARLHAEVDAVLPGGRLPTAGDLDRLPYARAVLAESMRLYPPAWAVAREAKEEVAVAGYRLPPRTIVLMSQWVTHHDPRWWPDPERFDPGRWLPTGATPERPRYAYYPFGGGPRNCIGEAFAWYEAILVLATIAREWRLEAADAGPLEVIPTITLRPRRGLPMIVRRR